MVLLNTTDIFYFPAFNLLQVKKSCHFTLFNANNIRINILLFQKKNQCNERIR